MTKEGFYERDDFNFYERVGAFYDSLDQELSNGNSVYMKKPEGPVESQTGFSLIFVLDTNSLFISVKDIGDRIHMLAKQHFPGAKNYDVMYSPGPDLKNPEYVECEVGVTEKKHRHSLDDCI